MNLPPPTPKVTIATAHRVLLKPGIDITICPVCERGKLIFERTMVMYNGILRDSQYFTIAELHQTIVNSTFWDNVLSMYIGTAVPLIPEVKPHLPYLADKSQPIIRQKRY